MSTRWIVGGQGTQADKATDHAGAILNGTAATWANCQGVNGQSLTAMTVAGNSIVDNGATITLSAVGIGFFVPVGCYVSIIWDANSDYVDDRYDITISTNNAITINYAGGVDKPGIGENATAVVVGGALGGTAGANTRIALQIVFDQLTAGDTVSIAQGTYTIDGTAVAVDSGTVNTGLITAKMNIQGVNSVTGDILTVGETRPIITANASIANKSPINVTGTLSYFDWRFIDCQGGGAGKADHAMYLNDQGTLSYHRFFNCLFHASDLSPLHIRAGSCLFLDCEMYDGLGGQAGAYIRGNFHRVIDCRCYDNAGASADGINLRSSGGLVQNCVCYGNGQHGIEIPTESNEAVIVNNTLQGNAGDGLHVHTDADNVVVKNNIASDNTGTQFELNGDIVHFAYFGYNHAYGGSALVDAGTWATLGEGNNITGNPAFVNAAGGDLRIGNDAVRFAGKPGVMNRNTLMGAIPPKYLGAIDLMRARYSEAYGGYAL